MAKQIVQSNSKNTKSLSFIKFWGFIASELGSLRLSIDTSSKRLETLFQANSAHPKYLRTLIEESLANRGGNLTQTIDLNKLLDDLGATAFTLRSNDNDDLFDIELLEEIAWLISTHFSSHFSSSLGGNNSTPIPATRDKTKDNNPQVISLQRYQIIKANKKL